MTHPPGADELCLVHGVPFNRVGWEFIIEEHQGYLPIEIQALPEGMVVPVRSVLAQVRRTSLNHFEQFFLLQGFKSHWAVTILLNIGIPIA